MRLPLVLASGSAYRKVLLERLGLPFLTGAPDIDESPRPDETAPALCLRLAVEKARALTGRFPAHLLIGSDQVAICDDDIIGKPVTEERAIAQLSRFSGRTVTFLTGLALYNSRDDRLQSEVIPYHVRFRALTADEIHRYIKREMPLDCAGSFKSEGYGITLFESWEGEDPTALIGLPLIRLSAMLRQEGLQLP